MGFSAWPLHCPGCTRRVVLTPAMTFGTWYRCQGCRDLHFVLLLADVRVGWIARVTAREASDLGCRRLTPSQVLRELGAFVEAA